MSVVTKLEITDPVEAETTGSVGALTERSKLRRRILKAGVICFNARHVTLPCAVRDLSDTGARLKVSGSVNAPDTFELHIELDGLWAHCAVVWRRGDELGVRFIDAPTLVAAKRRQVVGTMIDAAPVSLRRIVKR